MAERDARAPLLRRSVLAAGWPSLAALGIALGLLVWLAWRSGGYFPADQQVAGAAGFTAVAALVIVVLPSWRPSTAALLALFVLVVLTIWTAVSAGWSPAPARATTEARLDLLYVALFGLGLIAAGSGRLARAIPWGVLAAVGIVVGAGLLSRLAPDVVGGDRGVAAGRLQWPLNYWNAFGALAAMGAVLALGLAADARARPLLRAVAAGAVPALAVAVYFSLSRGAWLAAAVGVLVLAALAVRHGSLGITLLLVATGCTVALLRLRGYPSLIGARAAVPDASAGHAYLVQLAVVVGLVGVAQWVVATGRGSPRLMAALGEVGRPVGFVVAMAGLVAAAGAYVVVGDRIEGRSAKGLRDAGDFVSRQWEQFLSPTQDVATGTARLTSAKGTRSDLYRVAIDGFEAHPLRGDGAGGFAVRWARDRKVDEDVRNAHSLELETLGELGLVGALLLLGLLGTMIFAAIRGRRRAAGLGRGQNAAVAAGVAVWVAHAAVDWDWQMPAVTGSALVLAAALYPIGRVRRRRYVAGGDDPVMGDWYRERARLDAATGAAP